MTNLCSGNSYLVAKRIEWNKTFKLKQGSVFFSFVYNIIHFLDYSTKIYLHDTIFFYVKFKYTNMFCFDGNKFWRHYDVISSKHVGICKVNFLRIISGYSGNIK